MGLLDIFRADKTANTPLGIALAQDRQGMGGDGWLGPGTPLAPVGGYSGRARAMDFPVGVNVSTKSRQQWGRTSYELLREMLRAYDIAQMCLNHKIDEIRSMEPLFTPVDGAKGDVDTAVEAAKAALAFPDREHSYDEWISLWLNGMLTFDSGPLKKRRNKAGEVIGLEIIDGSTVYPYIDGHGRRPKAPAPAYYQVIKGQIFQEFTAEDVIYPRFRPQTDSPFGMAPMESIMMAVNTDMRLQWHFLQMFTDGNIPGGLMEAPPDLSSPDQVAEFQDFWNATFTGDQEQKHRVVFVPSGAHFQQTVPDTFDPNFPKWLAIKVCGAFGVVPQDIGLTDDVNRATGETQTDTQFRVNTLPWVRFVESHLNRYLQHDLGLPVQVNLNTGRDKEDRLQEAQAWKIYTEAGFASVDEAREELLGLKTDNKRPVPRFVLSTRQGPIPLESILAISGAVDPETKAPVADVPLNETPFAGAPGLMPDKLPGGADFKRAPIDPDEPDFPALEHSHPDTGTVAPAAPAASTPAPPVKKSDPDDAAARELAKFRAFTKTRQRKGSWRDFEFTTIHKSVADHLNAQARESFAKDDPDLGGSDAGPKAGTSSWRDAPPVTTPQHLVDLKLTDYWTPKVQDALMGLWEASDYEAATSATSGLGDVATGVYRNVVRQALEGAIKPGQLDAVVTDAWADAYKVGIMAAQVQMGKIPVGWDAWKPGMTDANQISADGWQTALDNAQIRLKGITGTTLDKVAARIADGVNAGDPSDTIGRAISDVLGDPARAELISHTETARMLTDAAMGQYNALGVTQWDLVTSAGACPICLDIAASNPHPVSDSSDTPPVHPRCRCAASPHIEGNTL